MNIIFENESILIKSTGRKYDFIVIVENKTDKTIDIVFENDELETISISCLDWIGILANEDGWAMKEAFENNQFIIEKNNS